MKNTVIIVLLMVVMFQNRYLIKNYIQEAIKEAPCVFNKCLILKDK